ncbi:MAG: glycosyltransferase family A protein [Akkermansia sp.]
MSTQQNILVTVRCLIFNHAPYVRQCLDGFVMQQTKFRFECIVHDDASTDGSSDIVREYAEKYPHLIKAIIQTENQYSKKNGAIRRIMSEETRGKYVAWCEGDDYWTDPLKLQKQVDFLEANPEYAMCHTEAQCYHQKTGLLSYMHDYVKTDADLDQINTLDFIIHNNPICTKTVCARAALIQDYADEVNPASQKWAMGDYPTWLWVAIKYKIHYMPEVTAVYRVLEESASHSKNERKLYNFRKSICDIQRFFNKKYNLGYDDAEFRRKLFFMYFTDLIGARKFDFLRDVMRDCSEGKLAFYLAPRFWGTLFHRAYLRFTKK